jgi:hypothetical protein
VKPGEELIVMTGAALVSISWLPTSQLGLRTCEPQSCGSMSTQATRWRLRN